MVALSLSAALVAALAPAPAQSGNASDLRPRIVRLEFRPQRPSLWASMESLPAILQPLRTLYSGRLGELFLIGGSELGEVFRCGGPGALGGCIETNEVGVAVMWSPPRLPFGLFTGVGVKTTATQEGMKPAATAFGGLSIPLGRR